MNQNRMFNVHFNVQLFDNNNNIPGADILSFLHYLRISDIL